MITVCLVTLVNKIIKMRPILKSMMMIDSRNQYIYRN